LFADKSGKKFSFNIIYTKGLHLAIQSFVSAYFQMFVKKKLQKEMATSSPPPDISIVSLRLNLPIKINK
jgi:hypothetical protein